MLQLLQKLNVFVAVVAHFHLAWPLVIAPFPRPSLPRTGVGRGRTVVGFDCVSCCSSEDKIRLLCEFKRVVQTHSCPGLERNVTQFAVNKLLPVNVTKDSDQFKVYEEKQQT